MVTSLKAVTSVKKKIPEETCTTEIVFYIEDYVNVTPHRVRDIFFIPDASRVRLQERLIQKRCVTCHVLRQRDETIGIHNSFFSFLYSDASLSVSSSIIDYVVMTICTSIFSWRFCTSAHHIHVLEDRAVFVSKRSSALYQFSFLSLASDLYHL